LCLTEDIELLKWKPLHARHSDIGASGPFEGNQAALDLRFERRQPAALHRLRVPTSFDGSQDGTEAEGSWDAGVRRSANLCPSIHGAPIASNGKDLRITRMLARNDDRLASATNLAAALLATCIGFICNVNVLRASVRLMQTAFGASASAQRFTRRARYPRLTQVKPSSAPLANMKA